MAFLKFVIAPSVLIFIIIVFIGDNLNFNSSDTNERALASKFSANVLGEERNRRLPEDSVSTVIVFVTLSSKESLDQLSIFDNHFLNYGQKYGDKVRYYVVGVGDSRENFSNFLKRGGYKVPFIIDSDAVISKIYNIKSFPTSIFIDKEGLIFLEINSVISQKEVGDNVEKLLRGADI